MCLFGCKCKRFKRLGENKQNRTNTEITQKSFEKHITNNRNTGYPAQDPTANIYIIYLFAEVRGLDILYLCFLFSFFFLFLFKTHFFFFFLSKHFFF